MPFGIKEAKTKQTTLPVSNGERAALIKQRAQVYFGKANLLSKTVLVVFKNNTMHVHESNILFWFSQRLLL